MEALGRLVLALAAIAALGACRKATPVEASPTASAETAAASVPGVAPARRPTRRYYVARREDRCEVYSIDGDQVSPTIKTPCPADLADGERIRLVGKTCMREGSAERELPVVCPDPLTNLEKRDLAAAAASASAAP